MLTDWLLIPVLSIIFLATLIRSAFGFGEALISVPLLALIIPVEVAAPVAVLVSITVASVVLMQDWNDVHFHSAGWLVLSSFVGIPLGLLLLTAIAEPVVKSILGIVIIVFSAYSLLNKNRHYLKNDRWAWLFGMSAGVLGGAYGMNGPPLVIYGSLRKWSPRRFRATLQGYFLPASIAVMIGYWAANLWTPTVTYYYLWSLPIVVLAIFGGRVINKSMNRNQFLFYIHTGLIIIGIILLVLAVAG